MLEFHGMKMINEILKKNIKEKEKNIKKLSKYVEKCNDLLFKFDDMKMANKMLEKKITENNDKYEQKIQEIKKELEEIEEYINIDAEIKDKAQKDINELNT